MLIYFLIYIPFILCSYYDFVVTPLSRKKHIMWIWIVVFTLFRGLRWKIGTDWDQFYYVFMHSQFDHIFNYIREYDIYGTKTMEFGYMFINTTINELGLSYTVFLILTNWLIMYCLYKFSWNNSKYPLLTFLCLMGFVDLPFPVRQTIAISIGLLSFKYLFTKEYIKFIIIALICISIHQSAFVLFIIFLVTFFLKKSNSIHISWKYYAFAYIATFFISLAFDKYIQSILLVVGLLGDSASSSVSYYVSLSNTYSVDNYRANSVFFQGISFHVFFFILLFIREKYNKMCHDSVCHFEQYFFLYTLSAVLLNLVRQNEASGMYELLNRITAIFDVSALIFPLIFIWLKKKSNRYSFMIYILFVMYIGYKFYNQIWNNVYSDLFIPYKSIFDYLI